MADNSFYGGRPGFSCVIVKNYASVAEMVEKFKLGGNYSEVHYNEYVLINTVNKNDPDNGKLYRRGYDYTNSLGGAIYIGTIVGPAGRAPHVEMTTIVDVKDKRARADYDNRYTEGEYGPTVNLVPGKSGNTYNDTIKWAACSVRDLNGEDTTVYIGFILPYLVEDFISGSVDPYYHRSNQTATFDNTNLVDRMDNGAHPFYQQWKINVPKGIKGDTFKNFKVVTADNNIQNYDGRADDVAHSRKVLVYEYYHYDKDSGGEPVTLYLGDYNMITGITINDEGTVTIDYTHDDDKVFNKIFKWVKSVTLNKDTGHFVVEYNHATDASGRATKYETDLKWVKHIEIKDNGDVDLEFSTGDKETLDVGMRWINQMTMGADGTVTVIYNDGTSTKFDKQIQWVTGVSLTEDGVFTIKYNNGTPDYTTRLIWVKDMTLDPDGTLKVIYNGKEPTVYDKRIKYVTKMFIESATPEGERYSIIFSDSESEKVEWINNTTVRLPAGDCFSIIEDAATENPSDYKLVITDPEHDDVSINLRGDQRLHVLYNTGEVELIGMPIKYIDNVYVGGDKKLHIAYNTGEEDVVGAPIKFVEDVYVGADKKLHVKYNTGEDEAIGDPIKFITKVEVLKDSLKVKITYNTGESEIVSDPLNYIVETDITTDYHFVVYYADPALRQQIVEEGRNIEWKDKNDWFDLGAIKEENGILCGMNLSLDKEEYASLSTIQNAIAYLNEHYPSGLGNEEDFNLRGKVVTIGNDNSSKRIYAFDYTHTSTAAGGTSLGYTGWYYLGTFTDVTIPNLVTTEDDRDLRNKQAQLMNGGVWFVLEE